VLVAMLCSFLAVIASLVLVSNFSSHGKLASGSLKGPNTLQLFVYWNPVILLVPEISVAETLVCKGATQGSLGD
jgi:hypothetical protein